MSQTGHVDGKGASGKAAEGAVGKRDRKNWGDLKRERSPSP